MDEKQLQKQLDDLKDGVVTVATEKSKEAVQKAIKEVQDALDSKSAEKITSAVKEHMGTINNSIKEFNEWKTQKESTDAENQKALDNIVSQLKDINRNTQRPQGKSFAEAIAEEVAKPEHFKAIGSVQKGRGHVIDMKGVRIFDTKAVGNLTTSNVTGDTVISYSGQQALLPAQKVNFRDLMRTVHSDTGIYVHYRESAGEGSIGNQTEGSAKAQIDFDFTEVQTVNKYVAGFTRFSKQVARSLPWLQTTLPQLLLREFFEQENSYFKGRVAAAATGTWNTTAETDKVKRLIDFISYQRDANFNVDYVLVNHAAMSEYFKSTYGAGYYAGAGTVMVNPALPGSLTIAGVPVIPVSWMTSSKALLVDSTYLERIEVDSLKVEFFEQDSDNVQKNLITARVECYEEVNPMMGAAFTFANL